MRTGSFLNSIHLVQLIAYLTFNVCEYFIVPTNQFDTTRQLYEIAAQLNPLQQDSLIR
jgi:hypothetical protein